MGAPGLMPRKILQYKWDCQFTYRSGHFTKIRDNIVFFFIYLFTRKPGDRALAVIAHFGQIRPRRFNYERDTRIITATLRGTANCELVLFFSFHPSFTSPSAHRDNSDEITTNEIQTPLLLIRHDGSCRSALSQLVRGTIVEKRTTHHSVPRPASIREWRMSAVGSGEAPSVTSTPAKTGSITRGRWVRVRAARSCSIPLPNPPPTFASHGLSNSSRTRNSFHDPPLDILQAARTRSRNKITAEADFFSLSSPPTSRIA